MFLSHQLALLFTQLLEFVSANTMPGFHASIMFDSTSSLTFGLGRVLNLIPTVFAVAEN